MAQCDRCGAHENLPYRCQRCGGVFCARHRLPENHDCPGLQEWSDPSGLFESDVGTDGASGQSTRTKTIADRMPIDTATGGPLAYFRNNMTYVFLGLMWVTFLAQFVVLALVGSGLHNALFLLDPNHIGRVWTWVTSVFAHSPGNFFHIVFNSIVLYFFGPIVERKAGSKAFTALFLVSGVVAGLAQIGVGLAFGQPPSPVLGASGAIMAVMGVLTVLNPNLRVLLFFFIPMPLWLLTLGFALVSVGIVGIGGVGAGGVAHLAHLAGLFIGLAYGEKLRRDGERAPDQLRFGGGPGGPGGPGRGRF